MKALRRIIDLVKIGETTGIAKRYMVMNSFDGSLTALGIIIGSFLAGVDDPRTLILAGLGASIAMGVSGGFGAYLTESALKKEELDEMEGAMLEDLEDTILDEAATVSSVFVAVVDGISPFLASVISFLPFFLVGFLQWTIEIAYLSSIVLTALALFLLGVYLGKISNENMLFFGFRMVTAGIITGILVMFLEFL